MQVMTTTPPLRNKNTGQPGNGGQFAGRSRDESAATLEAHIPTSPEGTRVTFKFGIPGGFDEPGRITLDLADGSTAGTVDFWDSTESNLPHIEVKGLNVEPGHTRKGYASALMAALELRYPGVPINHLGLTGEGRAFNRRYYGDAVGNELSLIDPDDSDSDDYEHQGVLDGTTLYRGGWTLDGIRIPRPRPTR
jgi:GNAT superfamily N-acetyltransferase